MRYIRTEYHYNYYMVWSYFGSDTDLNRSLRRPTLSYWRFAPIRRSASSMHRHSQNAYTNIAVCCVERASLRRTQHKQVRAAQRCVCIFEWNYTKSNQSLDDGMLLMKTLMIRVDPMRESCRSWHIWPSWTEGFFAQYNRKCSNRLSLVYDMGMSMVINVIGLQHTWVDTFRNESAKLTKNTFAGLTLSISIA